MRNKCKSARILAVMLGMSLCLPATTLYAEENWTVQDGFDKPSCLGANGELVVQSSDKEILNAIQSFEPFSVEGTIDVGNGKQDINEYYDFSKFSKFEIADWAYENELISEEERMECYCELFINRNFNQIYCLENVYDEIRQYRNTHSLSDELNGKIDKVYSGVASPDYVPVLPSVPTYQSSNFIVYYVKDISLQSVKNVADYFETLYTYFSNIGFKKPLKRANSTKYEIYLETAPGSGDYEATNFSALTSIDAVNGSACTSHIAIYNFSDQQINDTQKKSVLYETLAHEYFHAIQNAYNYQVNWFKEAAALMAASVYNNRINSREFILEYIRPFIANIDVKSLLGLKKEDGYGAMLFPLTIYQEYGGWGTIKKIYEAYNGVSATITMSKLRDVIDIGMENNGYSNGFASAYRTLATYVLNRKFFRKSITNYQNFSNKKDQTMNSFSVPTQGGFFSASVPGTTSKYYRITFPSGYSGSAYIRLINQESATFTYMQLYTEDSTGYHAEMVDVSTTLYVDPDVTEIILVISNASSSSSAASVTVTIYPN